MNGKSRATRIVLLLLVAVWMSGCMAWRPRWPGDAPAPLPEAVVERMAAADLLAEVAADRAGVEAAIAAYEKVVALDPWHSGAHVHLAHLHLLMGDGYARSRTAKQAYFQQAMHHAEAAMYAHQAFRERIRAGEPVWTACEALGEAELDAMFFWINAVLYQFKEALWAPNQALNVRWIRRVRRMMDHMETLAPEGDIRMDFLLGAYYLSIPPVIGGDRERSAAYFHAAVENAPDALMPRWGRAKYYHVKMNHPEEFREDLTWVITRDPDEMKDHPAWRHFFMKDAWRMLAETEPPFRHRTGRYRRTLREHWPEGAGSSGPLPVVLVLHGAFSTGRQMDQWGEWSDLADRMKFGVVFPEGIGLLGKLQHWNAGHCCGRAVRMEWDDMAYLDAVVDHLAARAGVDGQRIRMVGFSNGGMMVHRYAAERAGRLAGAAVVSGALHSLETPATSPWRPPEPAATVPMMLIHGEADLPVPVEGGMPLDGRSERVYASLDDAIDFWARANRAVGMVERRTDHEGAVKQEIYRDRNGGKVLKAVRIEGWGHQWPGGSVIRALPGDHPLQGFDAATLIWEFFRQHKDR